MTAPDIVVTIDRLAPSGDGIAFHEGRPIHIPFALPGESVRVGMGSGRHAELVEVVAPSPDRVAPFCPHAGRCGGCRLQHLAEEPYRAFKRDLVVKALARRGIAVSADLALIDAHGEGRRRITLHVVPAVQGYQAGFMVAGTHRLEPLGSCPVTVPGLSTGPAVARAIAVALRAKQPFEVQLTATETGLDVDVQGLVVSDPSRIAALAEFAQAEQLARLTVAGDAIAVLRDPSIMMGTARVVLPPAAFLQATRAGEEALAAFAQNALAKCRRVADLFCGVGPFTLRLARQAAVFACDSSSTAIAALTSAYRLTPGLKPVDAQVRDLFRHPVVAQELKNVDGALFDPARQGAQAQSRELARSSLKRVVAISCDPETFARDASILLDGGFVLDRIVAVDQFKWTSHIEIAASFVRKRL